MPVENLILSLAASFAHFKHSAACGLIALRAVTKSTERIPFCIPASVSARPPSSQDKMVFRSVQLPAKRYVGGSGRID